MSARYVIKQGDYLAKVALDHGLSDWKSVWDAPENAELRKLRKNPNVLFAGDVVVVPEKSTREETGATEARHQFRASGKPQRFRLLLEDPATGPLRDTKCELDLDGVPHALRTDAEGRISVEIPPTAGRALLQVDDRDAALSARPLELRIGDLDPVSTFEGQAERLGNLGYLRGLPVGADDPDFRSAVEEFQCDRGLAVDGACGPQTQRKLEEVHGC